MNMGQSGSSFQLPPLSRINKRFSIKLRWPFHFTHRHCLDTSCFHSYS